MVLISIRHGRPLFYTGSGEEAQHAGGTDLPKSWSQRPLCEEVAHARIAMENSRRGFLGSVCVLASLPTSWVAFEDALHTIALSPNSNDETYWSLVKRQFPLEKGLIYLNAPVFAPRPDRCSTGTRNSCATSSPILHSRIVLNTRLSFSNTRTIGELITYGCGRKHVKPGY